MRSTISKSPSIASLESSFNELVVLIDEVTKMETDYSAEMFKVMKGYLDQANALVALGAGEVAGRRFTASLSKISFATSTLTFNSR